MKTLLIVAGLFFTACAAGGVYFALSDPGNEYDLKFVLPIDARQMPETIAAPAVIAQTEQGEPAVVPAEGRADEGPSLAVPEHPPLSFRDGPGAASEVHPQE